MSSMRERLAGLRQRRTASLRWITSDIAVSAAPGRDWWRAIHAAGVGAAVDLRTREEGGGWADALPSGFALYWFPIEDHGAPPLAELLPVSDRVVAWVVDGSRVAIGCREGRGRSALLACAALMRLGYPLERAYELVRSAQPGIALSERQISVLEELSRS